MLRRAERTAGALARLGAGDRFCTFPDDRPEFCDLWCAAGLLGAMLVPINPLPTSTSPATHSVTPATGRCHQADLRAGVDKAGRKAGTMPLRRGATGQVGPSATLPGP